MKQNDSLKAGSRETYRFLRLIKRNRVLHWRTQYAWNMPFSSGQRTRLLDAELDRSIIYLIFSFSRWAKLVNRNMKLLNVSHKRSLSQSIFLLFLWQSICRVVRELNSCRRVNKLISPVPNLCESFRNRYPAPCPLRGRCSSLYVNRYF